MLQIHHLVIIIDLTLLPFYNFDYLPIPSHIFKKQRQINVQTKSNMKHSLPSIILVIFIVFFKRILTKVLFLNIIDANSNQF